MVSRINTSALLCILIFSSICFAQDSLNISTESILFNHWGHIKGVHLVDENTTIAAVENHGLAVVEIDQDLNIEETATHFHKDDFREFVEYQGYLYAITNRDEISVININDPQNIELVSRWNVSQDDDEYLVFIKIENEHLVTISSYGGGYDIFNWTVYEIEAYSLADPANPQLVGYGTLEHGDAIESISDVAVSDTHLIVSIYHMTYAVPLEGEEPWDDDFELGDFDNHVTGLNFRDGYLYAVIADSLNVYDFQNAPELELVNTILLPSNNGSLEDEDGELLLWGWDTWWNDLNYPEYARRYDVSDPANPQEVYVQPLNYNYDCAVHVGNLLVGSPAANDVFYIHDISDPAILEPLSEYRSTGYIKDVAIFENWGFALHNQTGLKRIDLSAPAAPITESVETGIEDYIKAMQSSNTDLFLHTIRDIYKYHVNQDGSLSLAATYELAETDSIYSFRVNENNVVALCLRDEIRVLTAGQDNQFILRASYDTEATLYELSEDILCIRESSGSLDIFSINDPENIYLLDSFSPEQYPTSRVWIGYFAPVNTRIFYQAHWYHEFMPGYYGSGMEVRGLRNSEEYGYFDYFDMHRYIRNYQTAHFKSLGDMLMISYASPVADIGNLKFYNIRSNSEPELIGQYHLQPNYSTAVVNEEGVMLAASRRWLHVFNAEDIVQLEVPQQISVKPASFKLHQAWPNPFNPTVSISFDTAQTGHIKLTVYNLLGKKVNTLIDQNMQAGRHQVVWNAQKMSLSSGTYFVQLEQDNLVQTQKIILMK